MRVINHKPHFWYLLEDKDCLYLDINCNMNYFGYSWTIELNDVEKENYKTIGIEYLDRLGEEVHNSMPNQGISISKYASRKVTESILEKIQNAIVEWGNK